jgi:hypothetical protein
MEEKGTRRNKVRSIDKKNMMIRDIFLIIGEGFNLGLWVFYVNMEKVLVQIA